MSDRDRREEEPQGGGVFGKLPTSRPGVRSPRRNPERSQPEKPPPHPTTASRSVRPADTMGRSSRSSAPTQPTASSERASAPPPPTPSTAAEGPEAPDGGEGPGVEDLAWAGVTVAAEAATLGVRLLSRALEAVRKPADRG
jgi:hypothetical protein